VKAAGYVISVLLNFGLYVVAFRFLTAATVPTRCLWLGAGFGSLFLTILQLVGGIYVNHVVTHASNTYGTFATVIGLLVWLHLIAQMTLYAAEINVVAMRRLWPRSLLGPPDIAADQETLAALAKVEERHDNERVDVHFHNGADPARAGEVSPGAVPEPPARTDPAGRPSGPPPPAPP
jgi:uncharacterized BrkB/YihY/UPF0761 family membrane protein